MIQYKKVNPINSQDPFENIAGEYYFHPLYACIFNSLAWTYNKVHALCIMHGNVL